MSVVPATTAVEDVLALSPQGVLFSNGPGDPQACQYAVSAAQQLMAHGVPLLGICLGFQLLFETSEENGLHNGLGVFKGRVKAFKSDTLKIPHMGWNHLQLHKPNHPVLAQMRTQMQVYFVHSYIFQLAQPSHCLATAPYGVDVAAVIGHENVIATQFHPEKSQKAGQCFLQEFLKWQP